MRLAGLAKDDDTLAGRYQSGWLCHRLCRLLKLLLLLLGRRVLKRGRLEVLKQDELCVSFPHTPLTANKGMLGAAEDTLGVNSIGANMEEAQFWSMKRCCCMATRSAMVGSGGWSVWGSGCGAG